MADNTQIEWTDATWNPITGCSVVSPGCTNCYAMKLAGTRLQHHPSRVGLTKDTKAGPVWTGEVRFNEQWLDQPLRWTKPRRIFTCAHGDLFHESVPDEWIDRVFAVMALAPQHTFQVLTKRAQRMRDWINGREGFIRPLVASGGATSADQEESLKWPLPNIWLGVSVEDQARADERIPLLLDTPAAVRFISAEPLLGPVFLYDEWLRDDCSSYKGQVDWAIVGGESGPNARPMELRWVHDIVSQCQAASTAVFVKQLGSRPMVGGQTYTHPYSVAPVDVRPKGKGGDMGEWPYGIRVRKFPP